MKKIFFTIIIFICAILKVDAASNPYQKTSPYGTNCTWYAWQQAYDKAGVALPGWGNANTWLNYAKKAGYETGTTPRAKSIVVWKWDNYGHVGYVESVKNGKIYVWDSEGPCTDQEDPDYKACLEKSPSEAGDKECYRLYGKSVACEYDATYWQSPGDLIGYIYLDKAPSKPQNTNQTNNGTTNSTPLKKSNNANLKSLTLSDIELNFKKDTLKYKLEVNGDISKINIEGIPEDNKAKINGLGEYDLNIGLNTLKIEVTAEDNTKKTYTLEIKRKDNNAYLENLSITSVNFEFQKEKLEYDIEIEESIKNIEINGVSSSSLATIEGLGLYELNEDNTTINIKVTAEDETTNTYIFNIKKKNNKEEIKEKISNEKKNNKPNYLIYSGIGLLAIIFVVAAIIIIKIKVIK